MKIIAKRLLYDERRAQQKRKRNSSCNDDVRGLVEFEIERIFVNPQTLKTLHVLCWENGKALLDLEYFFFRQSTKKN